jgi:short-subunit dehydrogenase
MDMLASSELPCIQQRPILITGCSSGIGYKTAEILQARGYPVFTTARKSEDITRLQQAGFFCTYLDYRDSTSIKNALQAVLAQTNGKLYGLFNNGAYGQPGAVEDISREALTQQFETNVFGWHELTCQVIPIMRAQGYGRIIQNSSILGFIALKFRGAYNASKFAIEGLTNTLRLELAGSGIQMSLIEPGPIQSQFRHNSYQMYLQHLAGKPLFEKSYFRETYAQLEKRLVNVEIKHQARFTLPAEAVVEKVIHALESPRAKIRYPVTVPSHLFSVLIRLLPHRWLDYCLNRIGA